MEVDSPHLLEGSQETVWIVVASERLLGIATLLDNKGGCGRGVLNLRRVLQAQLVGSLRHILVVDVIGERVVAGGGLHVATAEDDTDVVRKGIVTPGDRLVRHIQEVRDDERGLASSHLDHEVSIKVDSVVASHVAAKSESNLTDWVVDPGCEDHDIAVASDNRGLRQGLLGLIEDHVEDLTTVVGIGRECLVNSVVEGPFVAHLSDKVKRVVSKDGSRHLVVDGATYDASVEARVKNSYLALGTNLALTGEDKAGLDLQVPVTEVSRNHRRVDVHFAILKVNSGPVFSQGSRDRVRESTAAKVCEGIDDLSRLREVDRSQNVCEVGRCDVSIDALVVEEDLEGVVDGAGLHLGQCALALEFVDEFFA